jgi:hypothetical protein
MSQRALPTPEDDTDRWLLQTIARDGWAVLGIPADDEGPSFAYSLGLFHTLNHPEIIVMGVRAESAQQLINDVAVAVRQGQRFEPGGRYDSLVEGNPLAFLTVAPKLYRKYVGYARWFYQGAEFPLLQCVWPDKQGVLPWEPGYDGQLFALQRVLGPAGNLTDGWLFPDPPNTMAFTLQQIIHQGQPILSVVRDSETGNWQFLTGEPVAMKDMMIVALQEIVRRDPSVTELESLPPGGRARREAPGKEWQRDNPAAE